jgi:hypothetical protein
VRTWPFGVVSAFLLLCLSPAVMAGPIGVGVYGGLNMPLAQDDAGSGFLYGAKLRITASSFLALEPTLAYFRQGDTQVDIHGRDMVLDGGQSTALGLNLIIGSAGPPAGMGFYGLIGLASHAMKQDGAEDQNRLGFSFGPGLEARVGRNLGISLDIRLHMVGLDGGGARKNIGLSSGLIYYLGRQER